MSKTIVALDVGEKRIGVAQGDTSIRIAIPYDTFEVNGTELTRITQLLLDTGAKTIVIGYPRNQSGETTKQTVYVESFAKKLSQIELDVEIVYQDESLTSVLAENKLKLLKKPYNKVDVDRLAASIILEDYMDGVK